jgi:hypothetical protein
MGCMKIHAAFFILFISLSVFSADLHSFAESKQWRSLLYANEKSFFTLQSRADSKKFFITENGKTDLFNELQASVEAVQNEIAPFNDQSFSCRFPARAAYIRKNILNINVFDDSSCIKLTAWKEKVSAESITLVFSSYYVGNPSSTFGHTLLRINNSGKNKSIRRELLSYGINYGANPWTQNPLLYTVYGLIGMFPGQFIALPYYYKVREYNDFESRDLWEYDLNLTPEEVSRVVDLLWEQGDNFNDYYFLTENCGYYIAALIEAAAPRFEILNPLRKWVIPSDTIVQFKKSDVIKSRKWRPSIYNQFLSRLSILSSEQKNIVFDVFEMAENKKYEWPKDFEKLNPADQAKVLDAALDYYDLKHNKELANDNSPENKIKSQLLIRRSQLPTGLPLAEKNIESLAPENAHGSFRWQISGFRSESKAQPALFENSLILGTRFAFHDLEDPLSGYPEGAHIEMFNFKAKVYLDSNNSEKIKLQEIKIFEMGTYPDYNRWTDKKSFDVNLGLFRIENNICSGFLTGQLNIAYGLSKVISDFRFSFLAQSKYMYGDFNSNHHNGWNYFGLGPRFIMQYDYNSDYQMRFEIQHQSVSTAENKLWSADLVFRRNIFNEYAIELGATSNEIQNIYNASVYYFTF